MKYKIILDRIYVLGFNCLMIGFIVTHFKDVTLFQLAMSFGMSGLLLCRNKGEKC